MKRILKTLFAIALSGTLFLLPMIGAGQSIKELEAQKKATEERIKKANELIQEATKSQDVNTEKLNLIKSQIATHNELISNIEQQIALQEKQIAGKRRTIDSLTHDQQILEKQYAEFLRRIQFNRNRHQVIMHILASENVAQMYRKIRFYREYLTFRNMQHELLIAQRQKIAAENDSLQAGKEHLQKLQHEERKSQEHLLASKMQYDQELDRLMKQENALRAQLQSEQKKIQEINQAIAKLLKEEARQNKLKKRDARYLELSKSFKENKKKLPWPVISGVITREYGEQKNSLFKGVQTKSEGIDISTNKNASALAIFPGEVSKIAHIPGGNEVVIIRHGDFLTLYSNLVRVNVRAGQKVRPGEAIGTIFTDVENKRTTLHFEIWEGFSSQNPRHWLLP